MKRGAPRPRRVHAGIVAAQKLARTLDPDPAHAFQVCRTALKLFDAAKSLHRCGPRERRLLHAAALLHDVGLSVDVARHHKLARDLILEADLSDFTDRERRMIACVARYHRRAHPRKTHRTFGDLEQQDQDTVARLAALLRIADGLDRSHVASARNLIIERRPGRLRIRVDQRAPNAVDIEGAMRKRALFEEVFELALEVVPDAPETEMEKNPS